MVTFFRNGYVLLLSYNPCDIFRYYNCATMHGLSLYQCTKHENNTESAYISGWSNYVPKDSEKYGPKDRRFVFINLSKCIDDVSTTGLIMRELTHHYLWLWKYDLEHEEMIISQAETETYEVFKLIKPLLGKVVKQAINTKSE